MPVMPPRTCCCPAAHASHRAHTQRRTHGRANTSMAAESGIPWIKRLHSKAAVRYGRKTPPWVISFPRQRLAAAAGLGRHAKTGLPAQTAFDSHTGRLGRLRRTGRMGWTGRLRRTRRFRRTGRLGQVFQNLIHLVFQNHLVLQDDLQQIGDALVNRQSVF